MGGAQSREEPAVPARYAALRQACVQGDIEGLEKLRHPKRGWLWGTCTLMLGGAKNEEPLNFGYLYVDDSARQPIHYLACGKKWGVTGLDSAPRVGDIQARSAPSRAQLLRKLLADGTELDLESQTATGDTPLKLAVVSNSVEVVKILLHEVPDSYRGARPNLRNAEVANDLVDSAVGQQRWELARMLVAAGALTFAQNLDHAQHDLLELMPAATQGRDGPTRSGRWLGVIVDAELAKNRGGISGLVKSGLGLLADKILGTKYHDKQLENALKATRQESADHTEEIPLQVLNSPEQVTEQWRRSADIVAYVCELDHTAAAGLLAQHNFDEDAAIHNYFLKSHAQEATAAVAPAARVPSVQNCIVCFDEKQSTVIQTGCEHITCDDCWRGTIEAKMSDNDVLRITCPHPECESRPPMAAIQELLAPARWERFQRLAVLRYVDANPIIKWCPAAGCDRSISLEEVAHRNPTLGQRLADGYGLEIACDCGHRFCWSCLGEPHEPASCSQVKRWGELLPALAGNDSEAWLAQHARPCPGCGAPIQRNGGCNHMRCPCGRHFCWVCGADWARHGPLTGGYYACNRPPSDRAPGYMPAASAPAAAFVSAIFARVTAVAKKHVYLLEHFAARHAAHVSARDAPQRAAHWLRMLLQLALPEGWDAAAVRRMLNGPEAGGGHALRESVLARLQGLQDPRNQASTSAAAAAPEQITPALPSGQPANAGPTLGGSNPLFDPVGGTARGSEDARGEAHREACTSESAAAGPPDAVGGSVVEAGSRGRSGGAGGEGGTRGTGVQSEPRADVRPRGEAGRAGEEAGESQLSREEDSWKDAEFVEPQSSPPWEDEDEHEGSEMSFMTAQGEGSKQEAGPVDPLGYLLEMVNVVETCRSVLRNSYILSYFLGRGAQRRHLEHLQGRLEGVVEQLSLPLAEVPHSNHIGLANPGLVAGGAGRDRMLGRWHGVFRERGFVAGLTALMANIDRERNAGGPQRQRQPAGAGTGARQRQPWEMQPWERQPVRRGTAPRRDGPFSKDDPALAAMCESDVRDQVYYAIALHARADELRALMTEAAHWRRAILSASRRGWINADDSKKNHWLDGLLGMGDRGDGGPPPGDEPLVE